MNKTILATLALTSLFTTTTFADEPIAAVEEQSTPMHVYAFTGVKSGYICNGYLVYDHPALQSGAGVTWGGWDAHLWNTWGLGKNERTHYAGAGVNETDYEIGYSTVIDGVFLKATLDSWTYPDTDKPMDDWLAHTVIAYEDWWIRPELDLRWGLHNQQGCIGAFKLSKGFQLTDTISLNVWDYIAYASKSWCKRQAGGVDKNNFVDNQLAAEIKWQATKNLSFSASIEYDVIVADDLRDAVDDGRTIMADGDTEHLMFYVGGCLFF